MRTRIAAATLLLVGALAACESTPTGVDDAQEETHPGVIVGRIDSSPSAFLAPASPGLNFSTSSAGLTVAAAQVKSDGTLETLATASVKADGSYRIENVPIGIDRLLVVSTSGSSETGRVIVHQALSADAAATAAPISAETTVEAKIFAELIRSGVAKEQVNTVELAQSIGFSSRQTAQAVAQSTSDLRAIAEGFKTRQATYTQVLEARGVSLDAKARFEAALPAAVEHAQARHAGAEERAVEAKLSASVSEAYKGKGVDNRTQVEASSAAETGLVRAAQVADANAQLEIARAALEVNLLARERQLAEVLPALGVPAAQIELLKQGVAQARAALETATTQEEMKQIVTTLSTQAEAALQAHLVQSGRVPQIAQQKLEAALQNLPSQAELEARLGSAKEAGSVASAYVSFFDSLRSSVQTAVSQLAAAGGKVDGKAMAEVFTGLRGHVQVQ
jgi:hypothetical protein